MTLRKRQHPNHLVQTDAELWHEVQSFSCSKSFSVLFDRYWSTLYTSAFRYLKDSQKSEDIAHDILVNLWEKRATLQIKHFSAYLRAATRYHVYKEMKVLALKVAIESNNPSLAKVNNAGDEKIAKEEVQNMLHQMINALPSRCQEIFLLSRIENLTNAEIADKLSISKRSVENQLSLALRHIRTHNIAWLFKMLIVLTLLV